MVSYWLGHADINTTHIYIEIDMEMKRRMLKKVGAPAIKKKKLWLIFDSKEINHQQNQALMALKNSLALPTTTIRP